MCEFISWIETKDRPVTFLTGHDIFHTRRGKELQKYNPCKEDWVGHGSIEWFFNLKHDSKNHKECTDFSNPENFPKKIVTAIKAGKMRGLGIEKQLLSKSAWAEYRKIKQSAWAEYEKIEQSAWAEYRKIKQSALVEYEKIEQSTFWDLFELPKNRNPLWK
jgi:hypothetical protein